eukprot:1186352-Prorocentrum_minimum.AAC.10
MPKSFWARVKSAIPAESQGGTRGPRQDRAQPQCPPLPHLPPLRGCTPAARTVACCPPAHDIQSTTKRIMIECEVYGGPYSRATKLYGTGVERHIRERAEGGSQGLRQMGFLRPRPRLSTGRIGGDKGVKRQQEPHHVQKGVLVSLGSVLCADLLHLAQGVPVTWDTTAPQYQLACARALLRKARVVNCLLRRTSSMLHAHVLCLAPEAPAGPSGSPAACPAPAGTTRPRHLAPAIWPPADGAALLQPEGGPEHH